MMPPTIPDMLLTTTLLIAGPTLALLAATMLAGCNLAPKYVRPVGAVPATLPQDGIYPAAASDAPDVTRIGWQSFFTDDRLRRTIANRLKEAQNTAAMLTTFNDVDMSAVMKLRSEYKDLFEKRHGVRLGFMGFFVKACLTALREIPAVNAEIDGGDIIYKNFYHIGVAVGTDKGLVVPVVADVPVVPTVPVEPLPAPAIDNDLCWADPFQQYFAKVHLDSQTIPR